MVDALVVVELLAKYGYVLVFLAALAESMPFLGMLVPGQAFVIFAGFLASQDRLELFPIIVAGFTAGLLGDLVGYELGKRYGRRILEVYGPRFRLDEKALRRMDGLFAKYGPFALIAARFSFLTRGLGPLLAGITRMRLRVFWPLNVVGAAAWSVGYLALGYAFGESVDVIEGMVGRFVGYGLALAVGIFVLYRGLRANNPYFTGEDAALAVFGAAFVLAFARLANLATTPDLALAMDAGRDAFAAAVEPALPLWRVLAWFGGWPLGLATFGLFVVLAWRRKWWDAGLYGLAVGGNEVLVGTMKAVLARARPEDALQQLETFSFPSGHAASATVFVGASVYVLVRKVRSRAAQVAVVVAGAAFVATMGLSRIALRVHYPSDVLGGILLGAAWLFAVLLVVEFFVKRTPGARAPRAGRAVDATVRGRP